MKLLAAVAVVALVPLGLPQPTYAAAETCQGQPATLVGQPGEYVDGTDGPDVIVSGGADGVFAREGDDLICVTGSTEDGYRLRVSAGPGDDSVLVTGTNNVKVLLGRGSDTFVGGDEKDDVMGGEVEEVEIGGDTGTQYVDDEPDTFRTGDGDDLVEPDLGDTVDLGQGDDGILMEAPKGPLASADGGPGRNFLAYESNLRGGRWVLDNTAEDLTRDGEVQLSWKRFTRFRINAGGSMVYRGSDRDEYFNTDTFGNGIKVLAGGGDDEIFTWTDTVRVRSIDGGPGRDLLTVQGNQYTSEARFDLDLPAGRYRYVERGAGGTTALKSVEDVDVTYFPQVTMRGDDRANRLSARIVQLDDGQPSKKCAVVISGGGGADRLTLTSPEPEKSSKDCPTPELRGDAGNDVLTGSLLDERLIGGAGRDVARGGPGRDMCVAETRVGC